MHMGVGAGFDVGAGVGAGVGDGGGVREMEGAWALLAGLSTAVPERIWGCRWRMQPDGTSQL
jgi:hypothetical protein